MDFGYRKDTFFVSVSSLFWINYVLVIFGHLRKSKKKIEKLRRPVDSSSGNWAGDAGKVAQFDFDSCTKTQRLLLMLLVHSTRVLQDAAFSEIISTTSRRYVRYRLVRLSLLTLCALYASILGILLGIACKMCDLQHRRRAVVIFLSTTHLKLAL